MIAMVEVADINNAYGNPVAELVQTACRFDSHITVSNDGKYINAKSLMGMMAFGLKKGMQKFQLTVQMRHRQLKL